MTQHEQGLGKRLAVFGGSAALLTGSLVGYNALKSDSDTNKASAGEAAAAVAGEAGSLVVTADMVDLEYCSTIATDTDTYFVDSDGTVLEESTAGSTEVTRSYIPQSVGALLPFDSEKAVDGVEGFRAWGDAVTTPLTSGDEDMTAVRANVYKKICEDPLYVEHLVAGFGKIVNPNTGNTVAEDNAAWMNSNVEAIDDRAESMYWNHGTLNRTTQEFETLNMNERVNRLNVHETQAALMIGMLERYFENSRFAENALTVYHIGLAGLEVGEPGDLPEMVAHEASDEQYEGNFLVFKYTQKDGRCIEVGLNLGDGRFAELVDGVCIQTGDVTTTSLVNPTTTLGGIPTTTVPGTTVPETTVPGTTVPETTVPGTTVPETTVPETTVPETTVPGTTVPDKVPTNTTPRGGSGSGGSPENGDDPENDSDDDGYGPGDRELVDPDGDGVHNVIDDCPNVAGPLENDGCPLPPIVVTTTSGVTVVTAPPSTSPQPVNTQPPAPATTSAPIGTPEAPTEGTAPPVGGFGG